LFYLETMNKFLGVLSAVLMLLMVGCSGGDGNSDAKVDVTAQIQELSKPDKDARMNASIELAKAGPKAAPAIDVLIPLLKDPESEVRRLAAYALGEIGPKAASAVPPLKELLKDSEMTVVQQAVNSLRNIDPKSVDVQLPPNVMTPPAE
jgi:HEAT repeat protein